MGEDEAKTKWCPFVRAIIVSGDGGFVGPANRAVGSDGQEGREGSRCIGSACMAWRAGIETMVSTYGSDSPPKPTKTGHCGLAGKP